MTNAMAVVKFIPVISQLANNLVGGGKLRALTSGAFEDLKEAVNGTDRNHRPPPSGQLSVVVFLRTTNGAQSMYSLKTKELFSYVHVYV